VKYGQYATIWCVVTLLSNEGNEGYPEMHFMHRITSPKLDNTYTVTNLVLGAYRNYTTRYTPRTRLVTVQYNIWSTA
jgi:hypothetical protein